MNSNELATLLAIYPPNSTLIRPVKSQTMPPEQSRSWSPTKLATCDKVQSKCHGRRHRRNDSIRLNHVSYDDDDDGTTRRPQNTLPPPSGALLPTSMHALSQVTEEPDFVIEEREAWSRTSPNATLRGPIQKRRNEAKEFVLYDELLSDFTDDEDTHKVRRLPAFAPTVRLSDTSRPKTSRGPESMRSMKQQESILEKAHSRFVEGSMSSRSAAVSSSWSQYSSDYEASESETDVSDSTPRASHHRRSSSIDLQDFQPPPVSASTIKRTLFRRRKNDKTDDKSQRKTKKLKQEKDGHKKPRKSLSSWNLHAIGERIGLFNNSSTSIDDTEGAITPTQSPAVVNILDDRKRKAEEAYAQQFGSKKQKYDTINAPAYMSEPDQPVTMRRRTAAADANATVRARRASNSHYSTTSTMSRRVSSTDHDARKEQSMKELQKENQFLRDLLQREQQAYTRSGNVGTVRRTSSTRQSSAAIPHTSSITSPIIDKDVPPLPTLSPERKPLESVANTRDYAPNSTTKAKSPAVTLMSDHPILKPTPPSRHSQNSFSAKGKSLPALPRPVSMIIEESEDNEEKIPINKTQETKPKAKFVIKNSTKKCMTIKSDADKENEIGLNEEVDTAKVMGKKEEWDGWDEDVF